MQHVAIAIFKLAETPPARLIGRSGIVLDPRAARVLVEILAWVYGLVHGLHVEAGDERRVGRALAHQDGNTHESGKDEFVQASELLT